MDFPSTNAAYLTAIATKNNAAATQSEVDAAATGLNNAISALKASALNFTALNTAINAAQPYAGCANVATLIAAAQDIVETGYINDVCATQTQVDAAKTALNEAIQNIGVDVANLAAGLSPNPATDFIQIAGAEGATVYIFNAAGQQVLSVSNYAGGQIQVGNLAAGIYTAAFGKQAVTFIKK